MGYAIIKDINNSHGYALNRLMLNLIPKDESKRVYLDANNISFSYQAAEEEGVYKLVSINLGNATLPYIYELVGSPTGASIDPISGVLTIDSTFQGSTVNIKLSAVYDSLYYISSSAHLDVNKTIEVTVSENSPAPSLASYSFTNVSLSYSSPVSAAGGNVMPTLAYTLNKTVNGITTTSLDAVSVVYTSSDLPSGVQLNRTTGKLTFDANTSTDLVSVAVVATLTAPDDTSTTKTANVSQNGKTLLRIEFNSYSTGDISTVAAGTTLYGKNVSLNLVYDSGTEVLNASENNNITLAVSQSGNPSSSITLTDTGNYTIYIYYLSSNTTTSVTVASKVLSLIAFKNYNGSTEELTKFTENNPVVITATYSDNTTEDINASDVTPSIILPGTNTYTISYGEKLATTLLTGTSTSEVLKAVPLTSEEFATLDAWKATGETMSPVKNGAISASSKFLDSGDPEDKVYLGEYATTTNAKKFRKHVTDQTSLKAYYLADVNYGLYLAYSGEKASAFEGSRTTPITESPLAHGVFYNSKGIVVFTPSSMSTIILANQPTEDSNASEPTFTKITSN